MRLSLAEVAQATGGVLTGPAGAEVATYHSDSREVTPGGLFFALTGAETDGHRFLADAVERGAAAVVVDRQVEMGMQAPGEIARLAALAQPRIGIITMVGTVHLEFFESQVELARAKGELVAALPPDGLALLPAGSEHLELLRALSAAPVTTFGP